ncbi:MAG TPA: hypothetical protein VIC35_14355 [Acidimicrobiia bacterium]|jgi:hypothetical protein
MTTAWQSGDTGSAHHTCFEAHDGVRHYFFSGVRTVECEGTGPTWQRGTIDIELDVPNLPDGGALSVDNCAPFVTLNGIANEGAATNAGWAVDGFRVLAVGSEGDLFHSAHAQVRIQADVAVRDVEGYVLSLGYTLSLTGRTVTTRE